MPHSRGHNQKWPTTGRIGYITLPSRGSPMLHSSNITPDSRGSPMPHSRGHNQKWPTNGRMGYITPAVSRNPNAS